MKPWSGLQLFSKSQTPELMMLVAWRLVTFTFCFTICKQEVHHWWLRTNLQKHKLQDSIAVGCVLPTSADRTSFKVTRCQHQWGCLKWTSLNSDGHLSSEVPYQGWVGSEDPCPVRSNVQGRGWGQGGPYSVRSPDHDAPVQWGPLQHG